MLDYVARCLCFNHCWTASGALSRSAIIARSSGVFFMPTLPESTTKKTLKVREAVSAIAVNGTIQPQLCWCKSIARTAPAFSIEDENSTFDERQNVSKRRVLRALGELR